MGSFPFKDRREDGYFSVGPAEPMGLPLEACQEPHPRSVHFIALVLERNWPEQGAGLGLPDCPSAPVRLPVRTLPPAPSGAKGRTEPQALGLPVLLAPVEEIWGRLCREIHPPIQPLN